MYYVLQLQLQGRGLRQASELLDQSYYVRQLGCAVGGVLVLIAKSEWRGGDRKKMEKLEHAYHRWIHFRRLRHLWIV